MVIGNTWSNTVLHGLLPHGAGSKLTNSRFTPSTKELSTDRPHALLCEQWDAYTADKTQITAFLHVLRDACKYKKAHLEEQFAVLQRCITRKLPKLETLLAAKKVIGSKGAGKLFGIILTNI